MKKTDRDFTRKQINSPPFSNDEKRKYTPPEIEILEIILEKGFAGSSQSLDWEEDTW